MKVGGVTYSIMAVRKRSKSKRSKQYPLEYQTDAMRRDGTAPKQKGFYTAKERQQFLDDLIEETRRATGLSKDIPLDEYLPRWRSGHQSEWTPGTLANYDWALGHIKEWAQGRMLRLITPGDVRTFLNGLVGPLAKGSVAHVHSVLHAVFEGAKEDNIIVNNPAHFTGTRRLKLTPSRDERKDAAAEKTMTEQQAADFLAVRDAPVKDVYPILFRTVALLGLRIGEGMALSREQFAIHGPKPHVLINRKVNRQGRVVPMTRNKRGRKVDLPQVLIEDLKAWEAKAKAAAMAKGKELPDLLFPSIRGTPLDYAQVQRAFKAILKAAKLPLYFSTHTLRHTFASTHLNVDNPDLAHLSEQLGHSSIALTVDLYGSGRIMNKPERAAEVARRLTGKDNSNRQDKAAEG